jgi:BioD-like phosphotransacetylase family protein
LCHRGVVLCTNSAESEIPTFTLQDGTEAILGGNRHSMLTGVILPTTGCWEISGQYRGKTLTFVISVEP